MGLIRQVRILAQGRDWRGRSHTPRSAVAHQYPDAPREFPTGWARTPVANHTRRAVQRALLTPLTWSQTRPHVEGRERLDGLRGPVVLVANHSSHLDAPLILGSLPQPIVARVAVGAAADYFFDARWRAAVTALVFNAFPVERYQSRRLRSLAPQLLTQGWSLLLFPEATRSEDGWMSQFRMGPAHLCVTQQVPAVPVVLRGTYTAMPRGRNWPVPGRPRVVVRYGTPVLPGEQETTRAFNDRLVSAVSQLWAEQEMGWYRSLRAQADGTLELPTGPRAARWRRIWESSRPMGPGGPVRSGERSRSAQSWAWPTAD